MIYLALLPQQDEEITMFGDNPVAHYVDDPDPRGLQIREIFRSVQGEGPFIGRRAIFIRITKCSYRCTFCDSSWNDVTDPYMSEEEILCQVVALTKEPIVRMIKPLIIITGGEPLLQNVNRLVQLLQGELEAVIQFETAGPYFRECLAYPNVYTVVSPKNAHVHNYVQRFACAYKYVISASDPKCPDTGIPITACIKGAPVQRLALFPETIKPHEVWLQPMTGFNSATYSFEDDKANFAEVLRLCQEYGYMASARLHVLGGLR
jgi:7-carboxy-7-deazaguanine synthase